MSQHTRGKWNKPVAPSSALSDDERNAPLETWTEREARLTRERVERTAQRDADMAIAFEQQMARARAWGCDDGAQACRYCRVALVVDATGALTHEANDCPGPGGTCAECRKPWAFDGKRWNPTCSAQEHESRKRDNAWALATREHNPLVAPPRVHKNDDD